MLFRIYSLQPRCERGTAFLELLITLPFLAMLVIGIVDVSFAMKEYFFLSSAVSSGATDAMVASALEPNTLFASGSSTFCLGANTPSSQRLHDKIARLITLQNRSLSSLCLRSRLEADSPDTAPLVLIQAHAHYDGLLPLFNGMTISAQTRVPYLIN